MTKAETYKANYGSAELHVKDVREVTADEFPKADLLWASFPCQDHSSAGARSGFKDGSRGNLVFHVLDMLTQVAARGKASGIIALENVLGLVSAEGCEDFERLLTGLVSIGYRAGAMAIDAVHWLPHSHPRVFIVAVADEMPLPAGLTMKRPRGPWYPKALIRALTAQPPAVARHLLWWTLPQLSARILELGDIRRAVWVRLRTVAHLRERRRAARDPPPGRPRAPGDCPQSWRLFTGPPDSSDGTGPSSRAGVCCCGQTASSVA